MISHFLLIFYCELLALSDVESAVFFIFKKCKFYTLQLLLCYWDREYTILHTVCDVIRMDELK